MVQDVIVYIIGALLLCYIAWRVWRIIKGREPASPCDGCAGCKERESFLKKRETCKSDGCAHCPPRTKSKSPSQASSNKSNTRSKP